jgi:prolyl-tRNA editing enzyme YbaK/EbsC (Cys-tRNA(Pro) deacylase)
LGIIKTMSTSKFQQYLNKNNLNITILNSTEKTHSAQQAADVHNVSVRNIIKSILVKIDNEFVLFLVPGDRKIDLKAKGGEIAKPEEVKNITGYSIGGVPPFGHKKKIKTYIEEGFEKNEELLAAAGSPNSVFKISFEELERIILAS